MAIGAGSATVGPVAKTLRHEVKIFDEGIISHVGVWGGRPGENALRTSN
jgi:hypothetical protein